MARNKPTVILETVNKKTYLVEQILEADSVWAVYHKGKPINLKTFNMLVATRSPKYKKVAHSSKGHAINLAKKLNEKFNTKDFTVVLLVPGPQIFP
jgi:hypothetical protein